MTAPLPDQLLEEEIRAMLQRRAQDVNPEPPPWRELAQRNGAVVISLRTGNPVDPEATRGLRRPGRQWFRGVLAAAVALIVAMLGALLVQGSDPNTGDSADGPEPLDVPAAGNPDFDAARATPLFPVVGDDSTDIPPDAWVSDPTLTAEQYLLSARLPTAPDQLVVDDAIRESRTVAEDERPVQTATVAWSLHAPASPVDAPLSQGVVFLRNPELRGRNTWLVVGVMTFDLRLTDVRREGDELSFIVDRSAETETFRPDPATVWVDDQQIGVVGYREVRPFKVPAPAGAVAVIKLQHTVDGEPWSITSTAVPALPGAPVEPAKSVTVPPTTEVAKRANTIGAQLGELAERVAVIEVQDPVDADPALVERRPVSQR